MRKVRKVRKVRPEKKKQKKQNKLSFLLSMFNKSSSARTQSGEQTPSPIWFNGSADGSLPRPSAPEREMQSTSPRRKYSLTELKGKQSESKKSQVEGLIVTYVDNAGELYVLLQQNSQLFKGTQYEVPTMSHQTSTTGEILDLIFRQSTNTVLSDLPNFEQNLPEFTPLLLGNQHSSERPQTEIYHYHLKQLPASFVQKMQYHKPGGITYQFLKLTDIKLLPKEGEPVQRRTHKVSSLTKRALQELRDNRPDLLPLRNSHTAAPRTSSPGNGTELTTLQTTSTNAEQPVDPYERPDIFHRSTRTHPESPEDTSDDVLSNTPPKSPSPSPSPRSPVPASSATSTAYLIVTYTDGITDELNVLLTKDHTIPAIPIQSRETAEAAVNGFLDTSVQCRRGTDNEESFSQPLKDLLLSHSVHGLLSGGANNIQPPSVLLQPDSQNVVYYRYDLDDLGTQSQTAKIWQSMRQHGGRHKALDKITSGPLQNAQFVSLDEITPQTTLPAAVLQELKSQQTVHTNTNTFFTNLPFPQDSQNTELSEKHPLATSSSDRDFDSTGNHSNQEYSDDDTSETSSEETRSEKSEFAEDMSDDESESESKSASIRFTAADFRGRRTNLRNQRKRSVGSAPTTLSPSSRTQSPRDPQASDNTEPEPRPARQVALIVTYTNTADGKKYVLLIKNDNNDTATVPMTPIGETEFTDTAVNRLLNESVDYRLTMDSFSTSPKPLKELLGDRDGTQQVRDLDSSNRQYAVYQYDLGALGTVGDVRDLGRRLSTISSGQPLHGAAFVSFDAIQLPTENGQPAVLDNGYQCYSISPPITQALRHARPVVNADDALSDEEHVAIADAPSGEDSENASLSELDVLESFSDNAWGEEVSLEDLLEQIPASDIPDLTTVNQQLAERDSASVPSSDDDTHSSSESEEEANDHGDHGSADETATNVDPSRLRYDVFADISNASDFEIPDEVVDTEDPNSSSSDSDNDPLLGGGLRNLFSDTGETDTDTEEPDRPAVPPTTPPRVGDSVPVANPYIISNTAGDYNNCFFHAYGLGLIAQFQHGDASFKQYWNNQKTNGSVTRGPRPGIVALFAALQGQSAALAQLYPLSTPPSSASPSGVVEISNVNSRHVNSLDALVARPLREQQLRMGHALRTIVAKYLADDALKAVAVRRYGRTLKATLLADFAKYVAARSNAAENAVFQNSEVFQRMDFIKNKCLSIKNNAHISTSAARNTALETWWNNTGYTLYAREMAKPNVWAGGIVGTVLKDVFGLNFQYKNGANPLRLGPEKILGAPTISAYYNGTTHWSAYLPKTVFDDYNRGKTAPDPNLLEGDPDPHPTASPSGAITTPHPFGAAHLKKVKDYYTGDSCPDWATKYKAGTDSETYTLSVTDNSSENTIPGSVELKRSLVKPKTTDAAASAAQVCVTAVRYIPPETGRTATEAEQKTLKLRAIAQDYAAEFLHKEGMTEDKLAIDLTYIGKTWITDEEDAEGLKTVVDEFVKAGFKYVSYKGVIKRNIVQEKEEEKSRDDVLGKAVDTLPLAKTTKERIQQIRQENAGAVGLCVGAAGMAAIAYFGIASMGSLAMTAGTVYAYLPTGLKSAAGTWLGGIGAKLGWPSQEERQSDDSSGRAALPPSSSPRPALPSSSGSTSTPSTASRPSSPTVPSSRPHWVKRVFNATPVVGENSYLRNGLDFAWNHMPSLFGRSAPSSLATSSRSSATTPRITEVGDGSTTPPPDTTTP